MQRKKRSPIWQMNETEFRRIICISENNTEVLKHFGLENKGGNNRTLKDRIRHLNINTSHFKPYKNIIDARVNRLLSREEALATHFIKNGGSRSHIRKYVRKFNLIEYKCHGVNCPVQSTWNDRPISLQLEHKNGVSNDHRLENLTWLCPNCHSQTSTFAGRSCKSIKPPKPKYKRPSKIDWPSAEEMAKMVWEKPLLRLGKELGVSDNAVKKFCVKNNIQRPPKEYWATRLSKQLSHKETMELLPTIKWGN